MARSVFELSGCCGIRELHGISKYESPEDSLYNVSKLIAPDCEGRRRDRFRYAIFSEARNSGYGQRYAAYILEHKLGKVVETEGSEVNPNSGNELKVFIWTIDHVAFFNWAKKVGPEQEAKLKVQQREQQRRSEMLLSSAQQSYPSNSGSTF